jgi:hypothetical protein
MEPQSVIPLSQGLAWRGQQSMSSIADISVISADLEAIIAPAAAGSVATDSAIRIASMVRANAMSQGTEYRAAVVAGQVTILRAAAVETNGASRLSVYSAGTAASRVARSSKIDWRRTMVAPCNASVAMRIATITSGQPRGRSAAHRAGEGRRFLRRPARQQSARPFGQGRFHLAVLRFRLSEAERALASQPRGRV